MEKPLARSFTIVGGLFFIVLTYLEQQGVLPHGIQDGTRSLLGTVTDFGEGISLLLGLFGLRRAQGEAIRAARAAAAIAGRGAAAMLAVLFVASSSAFLSGCMSYDAATIRALAERNLSGTAADECADFLRASEALRDGPDSALRVIGRGSELLGEADAMQSHALECLEVRGRELSPAHADRVRNAFDRSWRDALDSIQ